jgi:hypothetical protein
MNFKEIEKLVFTIFKDTRVRKVDTVWEKSDTGWMWILNIHNLTWEETIIIYTKFIFKFDEDKKTSTGEFSFLYDLNCKYKSMSFENILDLENKINKIIEKRKFGPEIKVLSDMIISPALSINEWFSDRKIFGYSVYDFDYQPKFTILPCHKLSFDFKFSVNNTNEIELNVKKIEKERYVLTYKKGDDFHTQKEDDISDLIGIVANWIKSNIN